jgi:hypothetical protein
LLHFSSNFDTSFFKNILLGNVVVGIKERLKIVEKMEMEVFQENRKYVRIFNEVHIFFVKKKPQGFNERRFLNHRRASGCGEVYSGNFFRKSSRVFQSN